MVPLSAQDVDTDQILPSEYLKVIERTGLGRYLFHRWKYDETGKMRTDFVLNRPEFKDGSILVAGRNFGIGSSRENAVWALLDYGFRCVIAPSFGDIFKSNAERNGLLCIRTEERIVESLRESATDGNLLCSIDLGSQLVTAGKLSFEFQMEPYAKERLLRGGDDIQRTLSKFNAQIENHESSMPAWIKPRAGLNDNLL